MFLNLFVSKTVICKHIYQIYIRVYLVIFLPSKSTILTSILKINNKTEKTLNLFNLKQLFLKTSQKKNKNKSINYQFDN